jgi:hypothetical protein
MSFTTVKYKNSVPISIRITSFFPFNTADINTLIEYNPAATTID